MLVLVPLLDEVLDKDHVLSDFFVQVLLVPNQVVDAPFVVLGLARKHLLLGSILVLGDL